MIFNHIKKAKNLSTKRLIKPILYKGKTKIEDTIKKFHFRAFGTNISDSEFFKLFGDPKDCFKCSRKITEYLAQREKPKFLIDFKQRRALISLIEKYSANVKKNIIEDADFICEHVFDLLGSGKTNIGTKINWHCDFKTGYQWNPRKYYKDIEIPYGKADIKVPWELSRFQHLSVLGQAYWLTRNEKYTNEFVNQISDWIETNPPKHGVNWTCAMDVAIRTANWILAYYFFKDSKTISNDFIMKFLKSLLAHGRHILDNLENKNGITNNHYLSNLAGLVYLGTIFPEFKEAEKWKEFGIQELQKEMGKQVHPDGSDFESSTCYHRLAVELFFFSTLVVVINDSEFNGNNYRGIAEKIYGKNYTDRLYKMFEVVLYTLKPNGRMPQIGDNDNGKFHIFAKRDILDMRYLLTFGAIFFKEHKFKFREFGPMERLDNGDWSIDALWIFGEEGYNTWQNLRENQLANIGSYFFPYAGWHITRKDNNYTIICCGSNGLNDLKGHCHNDKLSFEICANEEDIIVDPGTYVYTSDAKMRNLFRSTAYHNTVVIEGQEQNRFDNRSLFILRDNFKVRCLKWESDNLQDLFVGEYEGCRRLKEAILHKRTIKFSKDKIQWKIKDEFYGTSSMQNISHTFNWHFHLAPQIVIEKTEKNGFLLKGEKNIISFKIYDLPLEYSLVISDSWFSPQYGQKIRSKVLKLECKSRTPFQINISIMCLPNYSRNRYD